MSRIFGSLAIFAHIVSFQKCSKVSFMPDSNVFASKAQADRNCGEECSEGRSAGDDDGGKRNVSSDDPNSPLQDDCTKLESMDVGQKINIGDVTIVIKELIYKDDSGYGGEVAGFSIESNSDKISYLVKAGGEGYGGYGLSWMNPNGSGGSEVHAISHVVICVDVPLAEINDPSLSSVSAP